MAIAHDAVSNVAAGTGTLSWTHTPAGTPRGVVVGIAQNVGFGDEVTGVTYGGVAMTRIAHNSHNDGEDGACYLYFLGAGLGTGAKTVQVSVSGSSSKRAVAWTVTAAQDTTAHVFDDTSINASAVTNPRGTLALSGITSYVVMPFWAAPNAVTGITPIAGWTGDLEHDFGSQVGGWYRYNTIASADVSFGFDQAADDALAIAVGIREDAGGGGGSVQPPRTMHQARMRRAA